MKGEVDITLMEVETFNRKLAPTLKTHKWTALILSSLFTGLGLFYTGSLLSVALALILLAGQGFIVYVSFITMGFLGMFTLPLMIANHLFCIFLTYKFVDREGRLRQEKGISLFQVPWIVVRIVIGAALIYLSYTAGYKEGIAPFTKTDSERQAVQVEAEKYLQNKYKEKFKVLNVKYIYGASSYEILTSSSELPEVTFYVRGEKEFTDDYLVSRRSYDLDKLLTPVVREHYGQNGFVSTVVNEGDQPAPAKHYAELKPWTQELGYQAIKMIVFADLTESSLAEENERLRRLIIDMQPLVKQGEEDRVSLSVDYRPLSSNDAAMQRKIAENFDDANSSMGYDNYRIDIEDMFEVNDRSSLSIKK
ncbi:hypothetical protein D3C72_444170 [compost metagenome]